MCAVPWEREGCDSLILNWLHFRKLIYSPHQDVQIFSILSVVTFGDVYHRHLGLLWQGPDASGYPWSVSCVRRETSKNHALWVPAAKPSLCLLCLLPPLPNIYVVSTWTVARSSNGCARQFNSRSWVRGNCVWGVQESLCLSVPEITKLL